MDPCLPSIIKAPKSEALARVRQKRQNVFPLVQTAHSSRFVLLYVVDNVGFFGLLIAITSISSVAYLITLTSQVSNGNIEQAGQLAEYSNLVAIETFYTVIMNTDQNMTTNSSYQNWLDAAITSANVDGIKIEAASKTILISTLQNPKVTGVVSK